MTISVVIPCHPARVTNGMVNRAVGSVFGQTRPADALIVELDTTRSGAGETRHRGLMKVTTDWVAFLDSDDAFMPQHLEALERHAMQTGADYVYSHYEIPTGGDPLADHFGKEFDPENPHQTTIVTLVRTSLAQEAGFLTYNVAPSIFGGEDWFFTLRCLELGATIKHLPEKTWYWHHHGWNSSGMSGRGDA